MSIGTREPNLSKPAASAAPVAPAARRKPARRKERPDLEQERAAANLKATHLVTASKVQMASDLVKIREQIQRGASTDQLQAQLSAILAELLPDDQPPPEG